MWYISNGISVSLLLAQEGFWIKSMVVQFVPQIEHPFAICAGASLVSKNLNQVSRACFIKIPILDMMQSVYVRFQSGLIRKVSIENHSIGHIGISGNKFFNGIWQLQEKNLHIISISHVITPNAFCFINVKDLVLLRGPHIIVHIKIDAL